MSAPFRRVLVRVLGAELIVWVLLYALQHRYAG
jgi:hypothetical protein